jgi:hypothetical protein
MTEWISVNDKLPLWGQYILVYCQNRDNEGYDVDDVVFLTDEYDREITHWMAIPIYPGQPK